MPQAEYCLPKQNVAFDQAKLNEPTLALLSGISKERGQEHFMVFQQSVNIPKFKQYLQKLREQNPDDRIALFMDNLSSHICDRTKDAMKEMGYRWAWSVPYSPEYNPIELVFSKLKQKFKALRAQKLVGLRQESHEALIWLAVKAVRKQDIQNCRSCSSEQSYEDGPTQRRVGLLTDSGDCMLERLSGR